jgi:alkylresorcinol/alkylpyrone synthase
MNIGSELPRLNGRPPEGRRASILSLETAVPPHVVRQADVLTYARLMFSKRYSDFERMASVFEASGIAKRHIIMPVDWYLEQRGWSERTAAYLEGASRLFVDSARKALDAAHCRAVDIDTIVTVSSTGIATPSLEARVAQTMGFRCDVERVPVFGLGCAGGVSGLSIATRLAQSRPGTNVLFVAVEICSAAVRLDQMTKANIVATALFGDGAAACVLRASADPGIAEVQAAGQHLWPNTLDIMGWEVDHQGFEVIFDRSIPPFAQAHLGAAVEQVLEKMHVSRTDIDRFACHPGGSKVLIALERALALEQGTLDHERGVLSDFGNMSAPTVLFVVERLVNAGLPQQTVMTALGPGFTASCLALQKAA